MQNRRLGRVGLQRAKKNFALNTAHKQRKHKTALIRARARERHLGATWRSAKRRTIACSVAHDKMTSPLFLLAWAVYRASVILSR